MNMTICPLRAEERKYTYEQSSQLTTQTGSIGYLCGNLSGDGSLALDSSETASYQQEIENWLAGLDIAQPETGDAPIRITIGDVQLDGVLYDTPMAKEFIQRLPATVNMGAYGGREYYGSAGEPLTVQGEGQLRFNDGDITYCPTNNTLAIFYAQTDRPNLTMEVYPIGRVTSDLAVFDTLDSRVEITFAK